MKAVALLLALMAASAGPAGAGTVTVASSDELKEAYGSAGAGDVIELAAGDYAPVGLRDGGGARGDPLVIRAEGAARLGGLTLRDAAHVRLEGLTFDYRFSEGDESWMRPFELLGVTDVAIRDSLFDGDEARGMGPASDGFPTAFGLGVRGSEQVTLEGNEIRGFYRGLVVSDSDDVTVRGTDMHSIRMDGMNFSQVERVVIEENRIHDFDRSAESKDHADMIQFWTRNTTEPSRDITIRDNVLNSGDGLFTQSIFMRNDLVDRGKAGEEMFYRDIEITGNFIANAHLHGITVGETEGLRIEGNSVLRNARSEGGRDNPALYVPQIRVASASRGVRILDNVTSKITGPEETQGWEVSGNVLVQDASRLKPNHYSKVFDGTPEDLSSLSYLADGPLGDGAAGAPVPDL